jgi:hypothetical protein
MCQIISLSEYELQQFLGESTHNIVRKLCEKCFVFVFGQWSHLRQVEKERRKVGTGLREDAAHETGLGGWIAISGHMSLT